MWYPNLDKKDKIKLYGSILVIFAVLIQLNLDLVHKIAHYVAYYPKFYFAYSSNARTPKMLVVWHQGFGENEQRQRIKIAAARIGLELKVVSDVVGEDPNDLFKINRVQNAARFFKPDLVFVIEGWVAPVPGYKNYVFLAWAPDNFPKFDSSNYVGILPAFADRSLLPDNANVVFNWYPTTHKTDYSAQTPKRLFYSGGMLYDGLRRGDKYKQVFTKLDQTGYLELYGLAGDWQHVVKSWHAPLPFDGISVLKTANAAGVSLVLHSDHHLLNGTPTGRIFEAAAANTVIISDQNKFVLDNFGDNVLYIDVSKSADDVFKQIDDHMQWIYTHPQQAQLKAQRCHEIVTSNYNLEAQLQRLIDYHFTQNRNT